MFHYTKALCRAIPKSIVEEGLRMDDDHERLDYELACHQHQRYMEVLKQAGLEVTLIEADETLPDCVFVEDIAVIIGKKALLTIPGSVSRRGESVEMKKVLESDQGLQIKEMTGLGTVDGGDVLFTGKEIFVGISSRTNMEGFQMLKEFFHEYPVHDIEIGSRRLHLKSMMTMASENTILCGESEDAEQALVIVIEKARFEYDVIRVQNDLAANCLILNGKLICRELDEFPESIPKLDKLPIEKFYLPWSELQKVDGCFTCASILY